MAEQSSKGDRGKAYRREYYLKNRERIRAEQREYYLAHQDEIIDRMGRWAKTESGRRSAKKWRDGNKDYIANAQRRYREQHRDELIDYLRRYRRENPEKYKAWCHANRDALRKKESKRQERRQALTGPAREELLKRRREYSRRSYQRNPIRSAIKATARRAKCSSPDKVRDGFIRQLKTAPKVACYWCGKTTTPSRRHIDHIKPLSKGGSHDVFNLCCACRDCNLSKGAHLPEAWSGQFVLEF